MVMFPVVNDNVTNLLGALTQASFTPGGRITLTTATPVLTGAVSAAATVYYTPYSGNVIPIYDGSKYVLRTFAELSNVLANSSTGSAGPAAGAAAKNYDLFVWSNAGTMTLTRGGAWNSGTARSATTENDLQRVQGILTNLNAITNGPTAGLGTYVGTVRTDGGAATVTWDPGSAASNGGQTWIGVWNMYNRRLAQTVTRDTTASWTNNSSTPRALNGSNTNRISFVQGLAEDAVYASIHQYITTAAVATSFGRVGIGLDLTDNTDAPWGQVYTAAAAAVSWGAVSIYEAPVAIGFHFLQATEMGDNTNNYTATANSVTFNALRGKFWW